MLVIGSCLGIGTTVQDAIQRDESHKTLTLSDDLGNIKLRLNTDGQCVIDQLAVRGREVMAPSGTVSGVQIGGQWYTTRNGVFPRKITVRKNTVQVTDIIFGKPGEEIRENWTFEVLHDKIVWRISRTYPKELALEDASFPQWNFAHMDTWTGGILDNGGVVWNKYLDGSDTTYGAHVGAVTLWNREKNDCLRITPTLGAGLQGAARFSHQPQPGGDEFKFNYTVSQQELKTKHRFRRYLGDRQDLWAPFTEKPTTETAEFTLQALDYARTYDRGTFKGLNGESIRELLNTAGRYGVIDRKLVGGNGWRSGYICLHEQWFAQIGMALDDPNYNANFAETLDNWRDHAQQSDGRMLSRWCYDSFDAMPNTFNEYGFYEAQWGYLMDSQPDYVINVAQQFDLSGDTRWLTEHKASCEKALDYLIRREVPGTGLVAMMTDSRLQNRGSDWFDIVWAAYQNALINAELYHALTLWADAEETLGDSARATSYRDFAARIKTSFNRPISEGGFWDDRNKWYVYWRDKDGSIHGNNLFTAVNFVAISYGICDDTAREKVILDRIEQEMNKENLFHWPTNFWPFNADEVGGGNMPFPNYENGDLFLSWGEVGVRAYARTNPEVALKYVQKVVAQYEKDGLSFQRYQRKSQGGAGDDILAGNCMTIVGLYRNIYGVQPKPNRLYLEPHLTPELNGTHLRYQLRGKQYEIDLNTAGSALIANAVTVRDSAPFSLNATATGVQYFPGPSKQWALSIEGTTSKPTSLQIQNWSTTADGPRQWRETSAGKGSKTRYTASGLRPDAGYQLKRNGKTIARFQTDAAGLGRFTTSLKANVTQTFELTPIAGSTQ